MNSPYLVKTWEGYEYDEHSGDWRLVGALAHGIAISAVNLDHCSSMSLQQSVRIIAVFMLRELA